MAIDTSVSTKGIPLQSVAEADACNDVSSPADLVVERRYRRYSVECFAKKE